jgi:catechol 2,3-dioxygenase-like lactoylglutathione lyase family enzyme
VVPAQVNVVTLGARDFGRLRDFYVRLGWELAVDLDGFAAFFTRGAVLTLFPLEELARDGRVEVAQTGPGLRGFTLAINVQEAEEVDRTIAAVRDAGGRVTKEPVDAEEFVGRSAYFADPEDNFWEVVWLDPGSRVADAVRRAQGSGAG